jgi:nicotinamidase-related amidase
MTTIARLELPLRRQRSRQDAAGHAVWETVAERRTVNADALALVLCDVWDHHWCRGAEERLEPLLPGMNRLAGALRDAGALIVHAPSETMAFYATAPARQRVLAVPGVAVPEPLPHPDQPLPIEAQGESSCDTPPDAVYTAWTRQHPAIQIDQERDAISDNGAELYSLYRQRGITTVLLMGVHTNMCVLNRSFAIKALVRWGIDVALVRDLTDTMYSPLRPPYVSHDEGTRLVVEYIEKFWCPTVASAEVMAALGVS